MKKFHNDPILYIDSISTGFIEIPGQISINIYASGCMKQCFECQNKELQKIHYNVPLYKDLLINIINQYSMANWVCFLGGDAVYQPQGLNFISNLSKKAGKFVCLYTGCNFFELTEINKDNIDLIIDGEYDKLKGPVNSPTTNQHCYINQKGIWQSILFKNIKDIKWDTEQHKDLMNVLLEN